MNLPDPLSTLTSLGRVVALDYFINAHLFSQEIKELTQSWRQYNPRKPIRRSGISLTSLDGGDSGIPDLDSIYEYNKTHNTNYTDLNFQQPTAAYKKLTSLHPILNDYSPYLGRSHLIRLDQGGFFPPHRDNYSKYQLCYRLIALCSNCETYQFHFVLEDKVLSLTPWRLYFIDTRLAHSVFSFVDNSIQLVLNVEINNESVNQTLSKLSVK